MSLVLIVFLTPARAGQLFDVQGVDPSDVLNMRSLNLETNSLASAAIVGRIPHDAERIEATGLSLVFQGHLWREVVYNERKGWVNAKFIKPNINHLNISRADRLSCFGNEPFWDLEINSGAASLSRPGQEGIDKIELSVKDERDGMNRPGLKFYFAESDDMQTGLSLIVSYSDICNDGATDFNHAFEVFVMGMFPGQGPAQGCCTFGF
jgi:uncharacterized membrane protein